MSDKISVFIGIILNIIQSITSSLPLFLMTIGLFTTFIGAILNIGGIIVLGILLLVTGTLVYFIELLRQQKI